MSKFRGKLQRAFGVDADSGAVERGQPSGESGQVAGSGAADPTHAVPKESGPKESGPKESGPRESVPKESIRELLARRAEAARAKRSVVELPPGDEVENDRGKYWLRRLEYPARQVHGSICFADLGRIAWDAVSVLAKDRAIADVRLEHCLFLDTETTGLAGGAGTIVFNSGLGYFDGGRFVLEQTFLRKFGEEPAALQHVAERLEERPVLVTFVGKAFDRHRLSSRMAVTKVDSEILTDRHLDLYYLARRRYKDQLPDTRLRTLEQRVLDVHREDDLPGAEAPAAFFEWMRDRTGPVDRVLEHNRIDVLSLVSLLGVLGVPGSDPLG